MPEKSAVMPIKPDHFKAQFFRYCFTVSLLASGCATGTYFKTDDGVMIAYQSSAVPEPAGTAILLHGLGSDLSEWASLSKALNRAGWSTLAVDLRGHGLSREWEGEEISWEYLTPEGLLTSLQDVRSAVRMLGPPPNLWIVGSSFGSNLGAAYASQDSRVEGLVLLSPGFNYAGIAAEPALQAYGRRPVLIAGAADDTFVLKACEVLYEKAQGPKKLLSYEKGGHGSAMLDNVKGLKEEIISWMNQNSAS